MGSNTCFYCGNSDTGALQDFALSLGLHLVPMTIEGEVKDPASGPYCYLSIAPRSELHPYGDPPIRLTDVRDPMLGFMRGYFKDQFLVFGHIYWSNDVKALAVQTKPYYAKLRSWIKREWRRHGDIYIGPEAECLISAGAQMVNTLPGQATFHFVGL
jgi:hypothetical protein